MVLMGTLPLYKLDAIVYYTTLSGDFWKREGEKQE
jgi:hypothetical protein